MAQSLPFTSVFTSPQINPKKKVLERLFPDMRTNAGERSWFAASPSMLPWELRGGCQHV